MRDSTISLPDELLEHLEQKAIVEETTVSELIAQLVAHDLARLEERPVIFEDPVIGLPILTIGGGMTLAEVSALIEEDE